MNKMDLVTRVEELGYIFHRRAKHGDLYRHSVTGASVEIPGSTSDTLRAHKNTLADAERGAVTNGAGILRLGDDILPEHTAVEAVTRILYRSVVPMRSREVVRVLVAKLGCQNNIAAAAVSNAAKSKRHPVVRLDKGWYVYDADLAALPATARDSAIGMIRKAGPRRAYRESSLRKEALEFARSLEGSAKPDDQQGSSSVDEPVPVEPLAPEPPIGRESLPPMFELLAADPGGPVVLRGEDGRLWLARPLATFGVPP